MFYEKAAAEVVMFDSEDVITTSAFDTGINSHDSWCGRGSYMDGGCGMGSTICSGPAARAFSPLNEQDKQF